MKLSVFSSAINEQIKVRFAAGTTWKDPVIDGRIILNWILWKWDVGQGRIKLFGAPRQ